MSMYGQDGMKVTVQTKELISILEKNREKHISDFTKAFNSYKNSMNIELQSLLADFKKNPELDINKRVARLPKPISHIKEYDRAINMLKLHSDPTLTIDVTAYQQFVEDQWNFKAIFDQINSSYLG